MFAHIKRSGTVAVQLTVIITLALVTGPSVVLVAYLSAIVTGRVPIPDSEDVYAIHSTSSAQAPEGFRRDGLSFPEFADIRDALASIPIVGVVPTDVTLDLVEMPTAARVGAVTRGYFSILGVRSTLGHVLSSDVGETTAEPVLVLSERLWRQRLHGDPDVIGRGVRLNNTRFGIVGVAGKDFLGGSRGESIDAWIPLGALGLAGGDTTLLGYRDARTMLVYARLQSSGQLPELVQRLRAVSQTLDIAYPVTNSGRVFHARSIESSVAQWRANTLVQLLFLAITTLTVVILLAVSNLTNVYVALSIQRARDTAVELALGATKFRLLVRSILDASRSTMIGCGLGTIFGAVTLSLLRGKDYVQGTDARVDPVTVLYAAAIGIIAACTIAGGASTNALKMDLAARLRTAHTTTPKTTRHLQGTLVAAQLAAATLLAYVAIVAAGRAVVLTRVDPGYDVERIMHAHLDLSRQLYTLDERTLLHTRLVQEKCYSININD